MYSMRKSGHANCITIAIHLQQNVNMRTTWIIIIAMILAGGIMYFLATRPKTSLPYDTITLGNTPDSIKAKTQLWVAYDPVEVSFKDSTWRMDTIPLKQVTLDSTRITFDKHYRTVTFYLDYNHQYFYDLEIPKANPESALAISFNIIPSPEGYQVAGIIDDKKAGQLQFNGPMMKMYKGFVMTYNNKLPADSARIADTSSTKATKTITVVEN